jgi:hypothetical protein
LGGFEAMKCQQPLVFLLAIVSSFSYANHQISPISDCRPVPDTHRSQFIVGYGSLMNEKSKREDDATVGENHPIYLQGFKRGWIQQGTSIGFSTTYLAVVRQPSSKINAIYFKLEDPQNIRNFDEREDSYCRVAVLPEQIQTIAHEPLPEGQYWLYLAKREQTPSSRYPIVQSYVDIFLSGCFELEEKYHLPNFARDCIRLTSDWSAHWVNDRIHPRTAFENIPYVSQIDPLIAIELPNLFKQIKIEGT